MNPPLTYHGLKFPNTLAGRVGFAVFCVAVGPPTGMLAYSLLFVGPKPATVGGWIVHIIVETLCTALAVFSLTGLVWAMLKANWAEALLVSSTRHLVIALFWFCLLSLPYVIYALMFA